MLSWRSALLLDVCVAVSAPGFLSHFPPRAVESLVKDADLTSAEQHRLATPVPTPPSQGPASVAPFVERFAVPEDVQHAYKQAWSTQERASGLTAASPSAPSGTPQQERLYGFPLDWPYAHTEKNQQQEYLMPGWGLPFPSLYPPPPLLGYGSPFGALNALPFLSPETLLNPEVFLNPESFLSPESLFDGSNAKLPFLLSPTLDSGPKMASQIGDSLGSQMGSSLGSSLATDLNLLEGLTNSAAQNFFNVFNGQFQKPLIPRQLATADILSAAFANSLAAATPSLTNTLATPTLVAPTITPTARPVAEVWNEAIENLQEQAANLALPSLSGFNASLPVIDTIGNGAGLSAITSHTGANLGSAVGDTLGNTIASTADLWKALFSSASSGFIEAISPSVSELASMFAAQQKRQLEAATCSESGTLYDSPLSLAFNDVPNAQTCHLICQLYSSPAVVTGSLEQCGARTSATDLPCLWTSYGATSHRCTLLFALANEYKVEGFVSEPVYCPGQTFVQTASALAQLQAAASCDLSALKDKLVSVPDKAKPPAPKTTASVASIPDFPEFFNPDADSSSIWKYNPDLPLAERNKFEEDVIYQVGYGSSNPLEEKVWGQSSDVKDWRGCLYLCHQDSECQYWTYHFDPATYNARAGACTLATNKEPKAQAVSRVRTVSGSRLSSFSADLFGGVFAENASSETEAHLRRLYVADTARRSWIPINKAPPRRLSESGSALLPTVVSSELLKAYGLQDAKYAAGTEQPETAETETADCRDPGFAYYVPGVTNATAVQSSTYASMANSSEDCDLVCRSTTGCVGFQHVPQAVLAASTTLQSFQNGAPCLLLSALGASAAVSVPSMVSGVPAASGAACRASQKPALPQVTAVALKSAETETATQTSVSEDSAETASSVALSEEGVSCLDAKGKSHAFAVGISIRGELLSQNPNVLRGVEDARSCHNACTEAAECTAFSWGAWGGCYLLRTVEAFVADSASQLVSGYADCEENSRRDVRAISTKARVLEAEEARQLSTCAKAFKGLIYVEGSVIGNRTDIATADECWSKCRDTTDCYYMTYLSIPATSATEKRLMCLWFDQVSSTQSVQTQLSTSAESNCDIIGDLEFESAWALSRVMRSVNVPAVASATGGVAALLLGGGLWLWRRSGTKGSNAEKTPPSNTSADQAALNAFGMPDPSLSMSPGAVERGSPALQLDDFEKVEPHGEKSTGKRLRRYF